MQLSGVYLSERRIGIMEIQLQASLKPLGSITQHYDIEGFAGTSIIPRGASK